VERFEDKKMLFYYYLKRVGRWKTRVKCNYEAEFYEIFFCGPKMFYSKTRNRRELIEWILILKKLINPKSVGYRHWKWMYRHNTKKKHKTPMGGFAIDISVH
jgi:hypothetical protein